VISYRLNAEGLVNTIRQGRGSFIADNEILVTQQVWTSGNVLSTETNLYRIEDDGSLWLDPFGGWQSRGW